MVLDSSIQFAEVPPIMQDVFLKSEHLFVKREFPLSPNLDIAGSYMRMAGDHPILTKEQEVELFNLVQCGLESEELKESVMADNEEELQKLEFLIALGNKAQYCISACNQRLIFKHAIKFSRNTGEKLSDLIQVGNEEIQRCIKNFDLQRGNRFSTYAYRCVEGVMSVYCTSSLSEIKQSRRFSNLGHKVRKFEDKFFNTYKRYPTDEEIFEGVKPTKGSKITDDFMYYYRNPVRVVMSLNDPVPSKLGISTVEFEDVIPDMGTSPEEEVTGKIELETLRTALASGYLTDVESKVLLSLFGFESHKPLTRVEISKKYNITPEDIRLALTRGLSKLEFYMNSN